MNTPAKLGCAFIIMIIVLKLWAFLYILNEVITPLVNGEPIGVFKYILTFILIWFLISKQKLTIKTIKR